MVWLGKRAVFRDGKVSGIRQGFLGVFQFPRAVTYGARRGLVFISTSQLSLLVC